MPIQQTMSLSIIIASLNDQEETLATIQSIRATAGDEPEIILVDDCSGTSMARDWRFRNHLNLKLVSNSLRCGCGPSRHIGALHATGDWLLITDSHMRFTDGWLDNWVTASRSIPLDKVFSTVLCATCLGLDKNHMDPNTRSPNTTAPRSIGTAPTVTSPTGRKPSNACGSRTANCPKTTSPRYRPSWERATSSRRNGFCTWGPPGSYAHGEATSCSFR